MKTATWMAFGAAAISLGLYESSFIGSAPAVFSYIRPIIPLAALFIFLHRQTQAYVLLFISGLTIELFSAVPLGFVAARWMLVAAFIDVIFEKSITNRSLYGIWMLVILARFAETLMQYLTEWLAQSVFQKHIGTISFAAFGYTLFADLMFVGILFVAITMASKRFLTSMPMTHGRYE